MRYGIQIRLEPKTLGDFSPSIVEGTLFRGISRGLLLEEEKLKFT